MFRVFGNLGGIISSTVVHWHCINIKLVLFLLLLLINYFCHTGVSDTQVMK